MVWIIEWVYSHRRKSTPLSQTTLNCCRNKAIGILLCYIGCKYQHCNNRYSQSCTQSYGHLFRSLFPNGKQLNLNKYSKLISGFTILMDETWPTARHIWRFLLLLSLWLPSSGGTGREKPASTICNSIFLHLQLVCYRNICIWMPCIYQISKFQEPKMHSLKSMLDSFCALWYELSLDYLGHRSNLQTKHSFKNTSYIGPLANPK